MRGHSFYNRDSMREQVSKRKNLRDIAPQSFACREQSGLVIHLRENRQTNLQLGHQRLQRV
jgi:hypothetical protein